MILAHPLFFVVLIIIALGVATLMLFVGSLVYETKERWRRRRWEWLAARYQESVALLVAGEIQPGELLRVVRRRDRIGVAQMLLTYAEHVQLAEEQAMLVQVFRGLGAVERAVRECGDWRWWIRTAAARRLGQMRDPMALPDLQALLQDAHAEVRTAALWSIIQLPVELPMDALARALTRGSLVSSLRVAALFLAAGRRVIPGLCAFVASPTSPKAQTQAIYLAGELHVFDAEPAILAALCSPHATVRAAACQALGKLESPGAVAGLVGALQDQAWPVRAEAAAALGRIGDPAAVEPLAALLDETNPTALLAVAKALARLGRAGIAVLRERQVALLTPPVAASAPHATGGLVQQVLGEVLAEVNT